MSNVVLQMGSPSVLRGSSRDMTFPGGIPVASFSFGEQQRVSMIGSGNAKPGAAREATFLVNMPDINVAELMSLEYKSTSIPTVKVNLLTGDEGTSGIQFVMTDAIVSSVQPHGVSVQFTLNFTKLEQRHLLTF